MFAFIVLFFPHPVNGHISGFLRKFEAPARFWPSSALLTVVHVFSLCPRGVRQVEGARARLEDNLYEMSKPLTRTEDDVDRENLLKDQVSYLKDDLMRIRVLKPRGRC
jgi:hypothetical protein